jgi:hypothetical protein
MPKKESNQNDTIMVAAAPRGTHTCYRKESSYIQKKVIIQYIV